MLRYTISFCALIAALFTNGQLDQDAVFRAIVKGDDPGVRQRIGLALDHVDGNDPIQHARLLELLGEQFYRVGDIGEARRLWDEAFILRTEKFGGSSAEVGVGHAYRTRYHSYMAAAQIDHAHLAGSDALKALELLSAPGDVLPRERLLALRERAYAHKLDHDRHPLGKLGSIIEARALFHTALLEAIAVADTIWISQLLHDIGNTFTDVVKIHRDNGRSISVVLDSALWYYGRSMDLLERNGMALSEPMMMEYFTTALVHRYAFENEGSVHAIPAYENAIRVLLRMAGRDADLGILTYDARVINKAQIVELYHHLAVEMGSQFQEDRNVEHLDQAINIIRAAIPYWGAIVMEYQTTELHKVIGSYGHYTFQHLAQLYAERYLTTGEAQDMVRAFNALDRNRNVKAQRVRLGQEIYSDPSLDGPITLNTVATTPGTLVIAYLSSYSNYAFLIDTSGLGLVDLGMLPFDLQRSYGRFNELPVNERSADPRSYMLETHAWYQRLLEPVLRGRPERELVILPHGSLANLPFEALAMDTALTNWSDVAFVGKTYSVRYAQDLKAALATPRVASFAQASIATAFREGLSDLPFNRALAQNLFATIPQSTITDGLRAQHLAELLQAPGLLHLSSHASAPQRPDALPFLSLQDRDWSLEELEGINVERDLVVLGSCSSGSGRVYLGENSLSMGHALLSAGAGTVVHTLWPVDDRATSELMSMMYNELVEGAYVSDALHAAKLEFMELHRNDGLADPFYWSGIVVSGEDVRFIQEDDQFPWIRAAAVILGICALLLLLYNRSRRARERSAS